MDPSGKLQSKLRNKRDDVISLCSELVRRPSENPPGDTTRVAEFITSYLDQHGIRYDIIAPQATMPNIVATIHGSNPGRHLVLNGHLDIFPAGDRSLWSDHPYSGNIWDDKLFGRGVADMKAGDASLIMTLLLLDDLRSNWNGTLTLTLVSDEETFGPWGAAYLLDNYPRLHGDCVLNAEPSSPGIVRFGERGLLWLEIETQTKGGHGGYSHLSANAIQLTAKVIAELDEEMSRIEVNIPSEVLAQIEAGRAQYDSQLGENSTDVLYRVTLNIGRIEGGTKVNMIADSCRTEIDIRFPIGFSTDEALKRVETVLKRYGRASSRVINRGEPNFTDPNFEFIKIVSKNVEAVRGTKPILGIGLAGNDCRLWRQRGVPCVTYGPKPYNMGAADEYVTVDDLISVAWVHALSAFGYLSA